MIASILALLIAASFAAAALYITLVEHPARLSLADGPLLAQWQPSYRRALPIQAGLAVAGGLAGFLAFALTRHWAWIAGALLLLANWPVTMLWIMPTNKRLLAIDPAAADAGSRRLLESWGRRHNVRSLLGALSVALFALAMAH